MSDKPDGPDATPLHELTSKLAELGKILDGTSQQVVEYLVGRQSKTAEGDEAGGGGLLSEKLDALVEKIDKWAANRPAADESPAEAPSDETLKAVVEPLREKIDRIGDGIGQQLSALNEEIQRLEGSVEGGMRGLSELLRPSEPEPEPASSGPASSGDWQRIIFGPELAEHQELEFQRQQLLTGLMEGDPGACSLIGLLLVFRSALTEKMPPLLKEIGEAYYRWQPKSRPGAAKMEEVLAAWLQETVQDAGIANTIELVHPGERFDSARHAAVSRGVEVTEVHGWIVLRDNGRVYTKASVSAK